MTLASLEARNYKTHVHTKIELDSLVSIIGLSDTGKSNLWKGAEMVLLNKPFPESHLHRGSGATEGEYTVVGYLFDEHGVHMYDHRQASRNLLITQEQNHPGMVRLHHHFQIEPLKDNE